MSDDATTTRTARPQAEAVARRMLSLLARGAALSDFQDEMRAISEVLPDGERAAVDEVFLEAMQIRMHQSERSTRENALENLLATMREVAQEEDAASVLTAIVTRTRRLLLSDSAYYLRYDPPEGFVMHVSSGLVSTTFATVRFSDQYGICGRVRREGSPVSTSDYLNDASFDHSPTIDVGAQEEGLRAVIAAPVMHQGTLLGILFAADRHERTFSRHDLALLRELAEHAGIFLGRSERTAATTPRTAAASLASLERVDDRTRLAVEFQDRLLAVLMRSGTPHEVIDLCRESFAGHTRIEDPFGRVIAGDPPSPSVDTNSELEFPLGSTSARLGTLIYQHDSDPDPVVELALGKAAHVCALLLFPSRATELQNASTASALLRGALHDSAGSYDDAVAATLGRRRAELDVAALDVANRDPAELLDELTPLVARRGGAVVDRSDHVLFVAPAAAGLLDEISERLARTGAAVPTAAVRAADESVLSVAADEADTSRRLLHALGATGTTADTRTLSALPSVFARARPGELAELIRNELGALLDYDRRHHTDLLETVRAVHNAGRDLRSASAALGIHPNTLHQRLQRIDTITGASWDDEDTRFRRSLALRALDTQRGSPSP